MVAPRSTPHTCCLKCTRGRLDARDTDMLSACPCWLAFCPPSPCHLSHSAPPTAIDRPRNPGAVSRGRVSTLVSLLRASLLVLAGFRREQVWTGKRWRAMLWASRWWLSALGGPPGRCARAPRPIAAPPFGAAERGGQRCGARSAQVAHSRQSWPVRALPGPAEPPLRVRRPPP